MPDVLTHLYNACAPLKPATSEQWVDTEAARGGQSFAKRYLRDLKRGGPEAAARCETHLLTGYLGGGKSSELRRLVEDLKKLDSPNLFPIIVDTAEFINEQDVDLLDLLLAIVAVVGKALKEDFGVSLEDTYLKSRFGELFRLLGTDVGVGDSELDVFGMASTKLKLLRTDESARQKIRQALKRHETGLPSAIRTVFTAAGQKLRELHKADGFVVMVDGLEKVDRYAGSDGYGRAAHRALFVDRAAVLTDLGCRMIYTAPISLVRSADGAIVHNRYTGSYVLPMIKVVGRDMKTPYDSGIEAMREMIRRRLPTGASLDDAIEPEALDYLIRFSGGSARDFIRFVQEACTHVDDPPITRKAARKALSSTINILAGGVSRMMWDLLADVQLAPGQSIEEHGDETFRMLEGHYVLEYLNGVENEDDAVSDKPWYAVNPILREMPDLQAAIAKRRSASAPKTP